MGKMISKLMILAGVAITCNASGDRVEPDARTRVLLENGLQVRYAGYDTDKSVIDLFAGIPKDMLADHLKTYGNVAVGRRVVAVRDGMYGYVFKKYHCGTIDAANNDCVRIQWDRTATAPARTP